MGLEFNAALIEGYRSGAQKARVLTEDWIERVLYCPACGHAALRRARGNSPVLDFQCEACGEAYEVKGSARRFGERVVDGAFATMLERLASDMSPSLLLLGYDPTEWRARSLLLIPRQFFTRDCIEPRPPLSASARRAGWVGCTILLGRLPARAKIPMLDEHGPRKAGDVVAHWDSLRFLRCIAPGSERRWIVQVLRCVDRVGTAEFTLADVYRFAPELSALFPGNAHVHAKIRQQLQVLRDAGVIAFLDKGRYRRLAQDRG